MQHHIQVLSWMLNSLKFKTENIITISAVSERKKHKDLEKGYVLSLLNVRQDGVQFTSSTLPCREGNSVFRNGKHRIHKCDYVVSVILVLVA